MSSHPGVYYFLDVSQTDEERTRLWGLETVRAAPPGTIAIWDSMYALYNAMGSMRVTEEDFVRAGWVEIPEARIAKPQAAERAGGWDASFQEKPREWRVFRSPTPATGPAASTAPARR
jgi:hypothetical protein